MSSRTLEVQITGDARSFQSALRKAEGSNKSFGLSLGSVAKGGALAAGAAGVGGLFLALRAGIGEWQQSTAVAAQTGAVLKSTGGSANVTAKQVNELATALMKKSGTDDEVIQSGENMLLTFTKIRNEAGKGNDIFTQTTKATLDLSVAMGKDMKDSAVLVGKALNDPLKGLTALTRVGVSFTAQQKATIKSLLDSGAAAKDTAKAQKLAAQEVKAATAAVASAQAGVEAATRRVQTAQLAEEAAARAVVAAQDELTASSERVRAAKENVTTSSQHLHDAQEKELDSVQKVKDAEQALKDAQVNVKNAQEALTQARVDAARKLEDLKDANRDAQFSEEEAQIRLERAQERLDKVMKDSTATDLDKREAVLDVQEATAGLSDAQKHSAQVTKDQADAEKKGVEGSKDVVDAKAAVHKAQEDEEKSARSVIAAQKDQQHAARDILNAERDLVDSQRAVAAAQLKTVRAQQALVVSQQAAARATGGVTAAQSSAGAAADKLTTAQQRLAAAQDAASAAQEKGKQAVGSASDLLKAQKIILGELNKEFGGSAEAYGKTLPGQIDILKQRFNNFAGDLVAKMVPVAVRLTTWLNTELPVASAKAQKVITALSGFWTAHGALITRVLTEIITHVRLMVQTLTAIFQGLSDLLHGNWSALWTDIKNIAKAQLGLAKDAIKIQIDIVKGIFGGLAASVHEHVNAIVAYFAALPGRIAATLKNLAANAIQPLVGAFTAVGHAIAEAIKAPINAAIALIDAIQIPAFSLNIDTHIPGVGKVGFDYGGSGPFFHIPQLDTGGLVTKTGLAVVDKGETFSGVGPNRRPTGGDTYVTVIVEGSVTTEAKLVDKIEAGLLRNARRNGRALYSTT